MMYPDKHQPFSLSDRFRYFSQEMGSLFTVEKAATIFELDNQSTAKILARWNQQGRIKRVKRGLYTTIPNDTLSNEFIVENPWLLIPKLFSSAYVGGWSAAEYWDLTEQLFNSLMVFTTQIVPHKEISIHTHSFYLKHINESALFGLENVWFGQEKMAVSDLHRTIVDFFNYPETAGGIQQAIDCLKKYLTKPEADLNKIIQYAELLKNGALYKRLGFLLEIFLEKNHPLVEVFKEKLTKGYAYLDPKQKKEVFLVKKWNLFVPKTINLEEKI